MDSERKALDLSRELRDALFALRFQESEEAVLGLDAQGKIATCSRGAWEMLGYEAGELEGKAFGALMPDDLREKGRELLGAVQERSSLRYVEWRLLQKAGAEFPVRVSLRRHGPATAVSIKPRILKGEWALEDPVLRETVARLQQLGAVGQLSAALAHQIRTPLHVIQSTVEFIQDELPSASPHQESLRVVNRNVERIAALTEALRGFVSQRKHAISPGDLNMVVDQACLFIEMLCKKRGIKLKKSLGNVPPVRLDADYLLGALYNIMANAVDAMPEGGVLSVVTALHDQQVTLTVQDTGRGMSPAVLEQIGRPFFTTKAAGTGLGVMVARQILEQHQATMAIDSKHDVGTRVHVAFPVP